MLVQNPIFALLGFVIHGDLGHTTIYRAHDKGIVAFVATFPKKPPSAPQKAQRNRLAAIAAAWQGMPAAQRTPWQDIATRARLRVHGYALYAFYNLTWNTAALKSAAAVARTTIPGIT
jgi:hypothetical protein